MPHKIFEEQVVKDNGLQSETLEKLLNYWKGKLAGFETLNLPTDYPRLHRSGYRKSTHSFILEEVLPETLGALSKSTETGLYSVLLSGYYVLLKVLSGQSDLLIGTTALLPLRMEVLPGTAIKNLVAETDEVIRQAQAHRELPFEQLSDLVAMPGSHQSLFGATFDFQDDEPVAESPGDTIFYDLGLAVTHDGQRTICTFSFASELYAADSVMRMTQLYLDILRAFATNPDLLVGDLELVSEQEKQLQLVNWNQTDVVYPYESTLQELFEQQVIANKDKVGVVHGNSSLTYGELNAKANRLARTIRSAYKNHCGEELATGTFVALYLDRGIDTVVSMLAVLKAGGAYVPISPDYPSERVHFMLNDTKAGVLIAQKDISELVSGLDNVPVVLSLSAEISDTDTSNLQNINTSNDLAYVIYTSGTTGQPKGVLVEHGAVVSFAYKNDYLREQAQRVVSLSPYSFDGFVFDTFYPLLSGGAVYLADKELLLNPEELCGYMSEHKIDTFFTTTALFNQLVRSGKLQGTGIRNILFGGEKADLSVIGQALREVSVNLVHVYGPTETVVYASAYHFTGMDGEGAPIGSPLNNKRFYVVDGSGQLVPVGCPGELWIGGAGMSRGYLNREDLTSEKFIENPFATEEDKAKGYTKVYRTGDLVRWLPTGVIDFIGRIDKQVKIRGHRIEPEEIERVLGGLKEVSHAVVVDLEKEGNKYLAAYVVMEDEGSFSQESLRDQLHKLLPDYMVPSTFTELEAIPLTINGKLDRRALPDPEFTSTESYAPPRTELEEQLCGIWQEVLGLDKIGVNDNFFRLGGNSINALTLSAYCRKVIGLDLPFALLYEHKTIAAISSRLENQELVTIPVSGLPNPSLSFAQERLLFIERFEQGTSAYHIPYIARLKEDTDKKFLEEALRIVINRHEALKTVFLTDDEGNDYQHILDGDVIPEFIDLADENDLTAVIEAEINQPFDLQKEPSIRLRFYDVPGNSYVLLLWHHVAFDGWSTDIFLEELAGVYVSLLKKEPLDLPELEISYADYAVWQRNYLRGALADKLLQYWENQLSGFETLRLPTDYLRPRQLDYQGRDYPFSLDTGLSYALRELARSSETTLYTVLLSAYYVMLRILSGQDDLLVGTPSDNRSHVQTQGLVGFFVNSLPLRAIVETKTTVRTLISDVHRVVTQAKIHQELPLDRMVDKLRVDRDPSRHPLFQVLFSVQDFWNADDAESESPLIPIDLKPGESIYSPARYDLSLLLSDNQEQIGAVLNYATSLFTERTISRMSEIYVRVLEAFVSDTDVAVGLIDVLGEAEKQLQLVDWNQTDGSYPDDRTLQALFEHHAEHTPGKTALVYGDETLSYGELNAKANQLAHTIRTSYHNQQGKELSADTLIAVYLERGLDMVVSMLGVLKAGGAYVPISPSYPTERVKYLLEDTKSPLLLLSQDALAGVIMDGWFTELGHAPGLVLVDDESILAANTENPENINGPGDLAYVIYTSGTTGQPKGVMTPHRGVVSLLQNNDYVSISAEDVFLHLSSPTFDAATFEIWGALTHGSTLVVAPGRVDLSPESIGKLLRSNGVSILWLTRSLFDSLYVLSADMFGSLRYLLVGGEALTADLMRSLSEQSTRPEFILNGYGPTESTTFTTTYMCEGIGTSVPLGRPINTRKVYVLNDSLELVPVGSPGELYIGGAGLARGYLNQGELTKEKFIDNPFATEQDKKKGYRKLYKTGDLVRWREDGHLEYLGRKDNQVKLRGYRIELGEIESVLNQLTDIRQSAVVLQEKAGSKYLAGYVVMEEQGVFSPESLREQLTKLLPDYMVPSTFTELEAIPLTQNGKLDRRALPDPEFTATESYTAPRTALEKQLCGIWQEVLGVERVGIHDNFFHIGGDSIVAIRVISKAKQQGLHFSVQDIFTNHAISDLAHKVVHSKDEQEDYQPFSLVTSEQLQRLETAYSNNLSDAYPATFLQKGMLLESTMDAGVYHDVLTYKINAAFNLDKTEEVFQKLIDRHEVLKTCFSEDETEGYLGVVLKKHTTSIQVAETETEQLVIAEIEKAFDFSMPLYRVIISGIREDSFLLTMSFHHAIIDGWSVASLITDFTNNYRITNSLVFAERDVPMYGEYVRNEREVLKNPDYYRFWSDYLDGYDASGFSLVKASMSNELGQHKVRYKISEKESAAIFETARELGVSVDTIFLSLYHNTLCRFEGTNDLAVGLVTNNRLEKQGGDEQLGLFLNTIPFRPRPAKTSDISALISQLAEEKNRVLKYKALPFAFIKSEWLSEVNNYQCAFNYTHFHINEGLDYEQNNMPVSVYEKINIPMLFSVIRQSDSFEIILTAHQGSVDQFLFRQFWSYYQSSLRYLSEHQEFLSSVVLPRLSEEDAVLLRKWNTTAAVIGADQTLHGLFEAQAAKTPDAVALVFKDERLTYAELDARSNQLAHVIRSEYESSVNKELTPDTLVALYLDRSVEMVIAILAVLKAGGAYVPVSTQYPSERTVYLLKDTEAAIILSQQKHLSELTSLTNSLTHSPTVLAIDSSGFAASMPEYAPQTSVNSTDLAYVIYTSGTTGQPKGVEITHGASAGRNRYMAEQSETAKNVYLFKTNYIFDVSVSDLFSHLFTGSQLVITESVFDLDEIESSLSYGVNASHFVPSQFPAVTGSGNFHKHLDRIYFSGESLTKEHLEPIDLGRTKVINYYGPTETGEATSYIVTSHDSTNIIGVPFAGTQVYVLNKEMELSPVGSPGELYVAGAGLARGYLNQAELTEEKFIDNPFATTEDKEKGYTKLYKTGDLVRWTAEGNLEYLGRKDNQVKIRGHRVELGEIESCLHTLAHIKQAVVIDLEKDTGKFLAAYVVLDKESSHEKVFSEEELVAALSEKLPDYMVPSTFTVLEQIPLTQNGKLDRRALPEPESIRRESYTAPRTVLEEQLCQIWQEVLGIEQVGIHDNFFRLGGDSMKAIQMASVSRKTAGLEISLPQLFKHKSISNLAQYLEKPEMIVIPFGDLDKKISSQKNKMKL